MSTHHFLFTYSVHKLYDTTRSERLADQVRVGIADIDKAEWSKLSTVETTFVGELILTGTSVVAKRNEAKSLIEEALRSVVDKYEAFTETHVYIELMVNGLGSYISIHI